MPVLCIEYDSITRIRYTNSSLPGNSSLTCGHLHPISASVCYELQVLRPIALATSVPIFLLHPYHRTRCTSAGLETESRVFKLITMKREGVEDKAAYFV